MINFITKFFSRTIIIEMTREGYSEMLTGLMEAEGKLKSGTSVVIGGAKGSNYKLLVKIK